MPASPRINFRITEEMEKKLAKEAKRRKKTASATARELLAEALNAKELADVPSRGRPKNSENS